MDPQVTYVLMQQALQADDLDAACELADALIKWQVRGGFGVTAEMLRQANAVLEVGEMLSDLA